MTTNLLIITLNKHRALLVMTTNKCNQFSNDKFQFLYLVLSLHLRLA
jgi:hypothetical protein